MTDKKTQTCLVYDAKDNIRAGDRLTSVEVDSSHGVPFVAPLNADEYMKGTFGFAISDMYRNVDLMGAYCVDVIRQGKIEVQLPDKPGFDVYIR